MSNLRPAFSHRDGPVHGAIATRLQNIADDAAESGQGILVEACSRRGILLPELRDWKSSVERHAFVLRRQMTERYMIEF